MQPAKHQKDQRGRTLVARLIKCQMICVLVLACLAQAAYPQPITNDVLNAAELQVALKKLTVLGSALYVAAHPDDENTALLAYLSKGRHIRTAYLSITRGEGGQNLIGSEQGDLLGIIRTQELLAARRIDGAEQFFTRAIDFGFSKSSKETLEIWGRERILSDVVWIIRTFRPDVIITRFSPTLGGHGNHTSSAILAEEAFRAAGDPARFPEQLKYVKPWTPKRIVFNLARFLSEVPVDADSAIQADLGEYSAVLGKSFTEIAGLSRSMHKSQGFGAAQNRGSQVNYFKHTAGDLAKSDLFDGIDLSWSRIAGGESVGKTLNSAYASFQPENPRAIIPLLLKAYSELKKLRDDYWVEVKRKELIDVIRSCAGLWADALASDYSAVPGADVKVTLTVLNRSDFPFKWHGVRVPFQNSESVMDAALPYNQPLQREFKLTLPKDHTYTQPYWLREPAELGAYKVADQTLIGMPQDPASLSVKVTLMAENEPVQIEVPVRYRWVDPVEGERYRALEVVPPVALNLKQPVLVFPDDNEKVVSVVLRSGASQAAGRVRLDVPKGWRVTPDVIPFDFKRKEDEATVDFRIKPLADSASGTFKVLADVGSRTVSQGIVRIGYAHIPLQTVFPAAEGKLVRTDLKRKGQTLGYILGSGDEVPAALRQVGYTVVLLSDEDLAGRDLTSFDAIIAGVRAYNTRPQLKIYQRRLLDYVEKGGTYIVQYVTQQRLESENLGPYPFRVSRDRVSVEQAPVTFLNPQHPLLNQPNKLTKGDFDGWVQERGLYFADQWDPKYETVIASNDPGESSKAGGLLFARYGKGYYVYTGYSFFRQLPAGVPGAYRLFVNMISVGK